LKGALQQVTAEEVARARPLILDARAGKKVDNFDLVKAYKAIVLDLPFAFLSVAGGQRTC
jgi:hypothetical protein